MPKKDKYMETRKEDWKYTLEKTGPAVTTFYEPKPFPPRLKESLTYLAMVYQQTPPKESEK
jgi:hypothetical protein